MSNYYHHDREQLGFYKKAYVKTGGKKKHVRVLQVNETKNSNLFDKNHTQENVKCHIEHEESCLR